MISARAQRKRRVHGRERCVVLKNTHIVVMECDKSLNVKGAPGDVSGGSKDHAPGNVREGDSVITVTAENLADLCCVKAGKQIIK